MRYLEEEDGAMMKTIEGSVTGFAAGTIYGTVMATWKDVPRVRKKCCSSRTDQNIEDDGKPRADFRCNRRCFHWC